MLSLTNHCEHLGTKNVRIFRNFHRKIGETGKIDTLMHKYMATDFPGFVPGAAKLISWPLTLMALYLAILISWPLTLMALYLAWLS